MSASPFDGITGCLGTDYETVDVSWVWLWRIARLWREVAIAALIQKLSAL